MYTSCNSLFKDYITRISEILTAQGVKNEKKYRQRKNEQRRTHPRRKNQLHES